MRAVIAATFLVALLASPLAAQEEGDPGTMGYAVANRAMIEQMARDIAVLRVTVPAAAPEGGFTPASILAIIAALVAAFTGIWAQIQASKRQAVSDERQAAKALLVAAADEKIGAIAETTTKTLVDVNSKSEMLKENAAIVAKLEATNRDLMAALRETQRDLLELAKASTPPPGSIPSSGLGTSTGPAAPVTVLQEETDG